MKKLPDITMKDWLDAEAQYQAQCKVKPPQPKGSITVEQFAEMKGIKYSRARSILCEMMESGAVSRKSWYGSRWVYVLQKKK